MGTICRLVKSNGKPIVGQSHQEISGGLSLLSTPPYPSISVDIYTSPGNLMSPYSGLRDPDDVCRDQCFIRGG